MEQRPIRQSIDPKQIRIDLGTQTRKEISEETIAEYAEAMENGAEFPPLIVFFDLKGEMYILADGFHRLLAHLRARPNDPIIVEQYLGTVEDAQWFSIGANQSHGLKRSNEDKRNATEMAFLHPNSENLSDRKVADHVGVGYDLVSRVRKRLVEEKRLPESGSRVGKDGRIYDVSKIGKKPDEPLACAVCDHYRQPRCLLEGETREPDYPACNDFRPLQTREPDKLNIQRDEALFAQEHVPREIRHRISRRKAGEYIDVPLSKTNTDLAAAEIRHFFDENYLAALVQSALKILKE